jgi:hypothetical protein
LPRPDARIALALAAAIRVVAAMRAGAPQTCQIVKSDANIRPN